MDVRLSQEKTRRNPPLAQTVWEEETLALSLLSASSRVVHGATFVHQSYVRSELMIFFYEDKKHNFYEKKNTILQNITYNARLITLLYLQNNTYDTYNVGYSCHQYSTEYGYFQKKYNYLQYELLTLQIIQYSTFISSEYTVTYNTLCGMLTLRRQEYFPMKHIIKTNFQGCI